MRKLQPCGTRAAYARHLHNKEEPCTECKAANVARVQNAPSGGNKEVRKYDAIIAAEPPVIQWEKTRGGVWVAVSVDDPHAETVYQRRRDQEFCAEMDAYFAPAVADEPECTDDSLLAAGSREI